MPTLAIECHSAEPDRPLFPTVVQHFPESHVVALVGAAIAPRSCKFIDELGVRQYSYRLVSRQPASSASSAEQNQRVPLLIFILICAYQRLVGL
jgi:hypothetical protein